MDQVVPLCAARDLTRITVELVISLRSVQESTSDTRCNEYKIRSYFNKDFLYQNNYITIFRLVIVIKSSKKKGCRLSTWNQHVCLYWYLHRIGIREDLFSVLCDSQDYMVRSFLKRCITLSSITEHERYWKVYRKMSVVRYPVCHSLLIIYALGRSCR